MKPCNEPVINTLRRLRRKIRKVSRHYPMIQADEVVEWIDREIKRRKK